MPERQIGLGTFNPNANAKKYVEEILDSGRISYGKYSKELERRFSKIHSCKYGVLSNSGTSSLQVALQAMKELYNWNDGDLVYVPASTFVATVNIVLHCKLRPVFIDVSLEDYAMDPRELRDAVEIFDDVAKDGIPVSRCIIPVHPFGQAANMNEIMKVAKDYDLKVIEDSCEAMFVYDIIDEERRSVGSIGDVGCFSFYVAHLITAGIGGIGITNDEQLAIKMRSLVNHGRDSIYLSIDDDNEYNTETIDKRFKFTSIGHSFRITELESAIALSQLSDREIQDLLCGRIKNSIVLTNTLQNSNIKDLVYLPKIRNGASHAFMMYPIVLHESLDKNSIVYALEERGIETRDMLPITNQPIYHELFGKNIESEYPVAKQINDYGFYVGCHQGLSEDDMLYVANSLIDVISQQGEINE